MTRKIGLFLLVAMLVGACGSSANGASGSPGDASGLPGGVASGGSDEPVSAPARTGDSGRSRAELREPEEGLVDIYARIFDRHRADGRKVTLFYWSGIDECYGLDHIAIKERRRKVVLTIFEGHHPEAEVCTDQAVKVRSIATLRRPLGNRKVVDGAR